MIVAAYVLLSIGGVGFLVRLVHGPKVPDRVISLDGLLTLLITAFLVYGADTGRGTFLIVGVVVAMVAFIGASTFARYLEERR